MKQAKQIAGMVALAAAFFVPAPAYAMPINGAEQIQPGTVPPTALQPGAAYQTLRTNSAGTAWTFSSGVLDNGTNIALGGVLSASWMEMITPASTSTGGEDVNQPTGSTANAFEADLNGTPQFSVSPAGAVSASSTTTSNGSQSITVSGNNVNFNRASGTSYIEQTGIGGLLYILTSNAASGDTTAMKFAANGGVTTPVGLTVQGSLTSPSIADTGSAVGITEPLTVSAPSTSTVPLIAKIPASSTQDIADFYSNTSKAAYFNYSGQLTMPGCYSSAQLYTYSGGIDDAGGPFDLAATTLTATSATISTTANPDELCNPTAAATYTLPTAATSGKIITFTDISTYTVTISAAASQTITYPSSVGVTSYALTAQGSSVTLQSDGSTHWYVIAVSNGNTSSTSVGGLTHDHAQGNGTTTTFTLTYTAVGAVVVQVGGVTQNSGGLNGSASYTNTQTSVTFTSGAPASGTGIDLIYATATASGGTPFTPAAVVAPSSVAADLTTYSGTSEYVTWQAVLGAQPASGSVDSYGWETSPDNATWTSEAFTKEGVYTGAAFTSGNQYARVRSYPLTSSGTTPTPSAWVASSASVYVLPNTPPRRLQLYFYEPSAVQSSPDTTSTYQFPYGTGNTSVTFALVSATLYVPTPAAGATTVQLYSGATGNAAFGSGTAVFSTAPTVSGATTYQYTTTTFSVGTLASLARLAPEWTATGGSGAWLEVEAQQTP